MALVRLPVDRTDLHQVRLYDELAVVVVSRDHPVAAYEEIDLADLAGEQFVGGPPAGLVPDVVSLGFPSTSAEEAVAVAASGSAVVILPLSVARLHHRKDAVHRPVRGLPDEHCAGLAGRARRRGHPGLRRRGPRTHPAILPRLMHFIQPNG